MRNFFRRVFGETRIIDATVRRVEDSSLSKADKNTQIKQLLQTFSAFKLMQRLFALWIVFTYIGVWIICAVLFLIALTFGHDTENAKTLANLNYQVLSFAFNAVVVLYLSGGVGEGLIERWKNRQDQTSS